MQQPFKARLRRIARRRRCIGDAVMAGVVATAGTAVTHGAVMDGVVLTASMVAMAGAVTAACGATRGVAGEYAGNIVQRPKCLSRSIVGGGQSCGCPSAYLMSVWSSAPSSMQIPRSRFSCNLLISSDAHLLRACRCCGVRGDVRAACNGGAGFLSKLRHHK